MPCSVVADVDPLTALPLEPGERVLWQGRPGFGAPWREVRDVLRGGFTVWFAGVCVGMGLMAFMTVLNVGSLRADRAIELLGGLIVVALAMSVWWGFVVALFVVVILLAKLVGPYHVSFFFLVVCGPIYATAWASMAWAHGWAGALARLGPDDFLAAFLLLGLPLLRIGVGVIRRLSLVYVVTDRRAASIRAGSLGARLLWTAPLVKHGRHQARVIWPWGMRRRGHVAVGFKSERRDVAMVEHPDHVVALVRDALGDTVRPLVPRKKRADPAPAPPAAEGPRDG